MTVGGNHGKIEIDFCQFFDKFLQAGGRHLGSIGRCAGKVATTLESYD
jgi:hypothetical protein